MIRIATSLAGAAALFAASSLQAQATAAEMPKWLTGVWAMQAPDGAWVEEWWTTPRGRMMIGASKTGKGEAVHFFEHMRIEERDGSLAFCALPKGQAGACFKAASISPNEIVFENAAHDYPQRVRYRREGDELHAEIALVNGGKPNRWRFKRAN